VTSNIPRPPAEFYGQDGKAKMEGKRGEEEKEKEGNKVAHLGQNPGYATVFQM